MGNDHREIHGRRRAWQRGDRHLQGHGDAQDGSGGGNGGGGGGAVTPAAYAISTYAGSGNYGADETPRGPSMPPSGRSSRRQQQRRRLRTIVDPQSRNFRRVDPQGIIRSFAGNGANGNAGDNG